MQLLWLLSFGCLLLLGSGVNAEPTLIDLQQSDNPLLIEARKYHARFVEGGDQRRAEEAYLDFISKNPKHDLVPLIYLELGYLYTGLVTDRQMREGAIRDEEKAARYFALAVKSVPDDKVAMVLLMAKVNHASLARSPEESFRRYIEVQEWFDSMSKDAIRNRLWLTHSTDHEGSLAGFVRNVEQARETATLNMKWLAGNILDDDVRTSVLAEAAERLPLTNIGRWAAAQLGQAGIAPSSVPVTLPAATLPATIPSSINSKPKSDTRPAGDLSSTELNETSNLIYWICGSVLCVLAIGVGIVFTQKRMKL